MSRGSFAVLAFVLSTSLAAGCAGGSSPADDSAALAGISALRTSFADTVNGGDPAKIAALYTTDAVILAENQPAVSGHDAILAFYTGMLSQFTAHLTITSEETKVAGDWAFDRGQFQFNLTAKAPGAPAMNENGKYIVIVMKQADGTWKVAREIGNSNAPMMPPAAAMPAMHGMPGMSMSMPAPAAPGK